MRLHRRYGKVTCSSGAAAVDVDLRKGGTFEAYVHSTEPEPRALESGGGEFLKAEGSRGWRGVE